MAPSQLFPAKLVSAIFDHTGSTKSKSSGKLAKRFNSPVKDSIANQSPISPSTFSLSQQKKSSDYYQSDFENYKLFKVFTTPKENNNQKQNKKSARSSQQQTAKSDNELDQLGFEFINYRRQTRLTETAEMTVAESIYKSRGRKRDHMSHYGYHGKRSPNLNGSNDTLESSGSGRKADFKIPVGFSPVVLTMDKPISVQLGLSLIACDDERLSGYFQVRKLLDAGACKQDGRVHIGDIVAMVNGHHLKHWQQMDVINMLRRPLDRISMVLLREKDPNQRPRGQYIPNNDGMVRSRSLEALATPRLPRQHSPNRIADEFVSRSNSRLHQSGDYDEIRPLDAPPKLKEASILDDRLSRKTSSTPSLPDLGTKQPNDVSSRPIGHEFPSQSASNDKLFTNGHVLSDEDSEDEHDHESVVTSLLNKYNPRRPFDPSAKQEPIVYSGKPDKKTAEKMEKYKAKSPSRAPAILPKLPEAPKQNSNQHNPTTAVPKLELSDLENSDTNLSQYNINGKETPNHSEPDRQRFSLSHAAVPVEHLAVSPVNNPANMEARFIPEITENDDVFPTPFTKQVAVQTLPNQDSNPNFNYPDQFDHLNMERGLASKKPNPLQSSNRPSNSRTDPVELTPLPKRSRNQTQSEEALDRIKSPEAAEKIDKLSNELKKLLQETSDPDTKMRKQRPKSATERLFPEGVVTPPKSPFTTQTPIDISDSRPLSQSSENVLSPTIGRRITNQDKADHPNNSTNDTSLPAKNSALDDITSKSPPMGFKTPIQPPPLTVPQTQRPSIDSENNSDRDSQSSTPVRPKSRRNWAGEYDGDFEVADDLLKRVKQISKEFDVDPNEPIYEEFSNPSMLSNDFNPGDLRRVESLSRKPPSTIGEDSRDYMSLLDDSKVNIDDFSLSAIDDDRIRKSFQATPEDTLKEEKFPFKDNSLEREQDPGQNIRPLELSYGTNMVQNLQPDELIEFYDQIPPTSLAVASEQSYPNNIMHGPITDINSYQQSDIPLTRENSSPSSKSNLSVASTNKTYDVIPSPEKFADRKAPCFSTTGHKAGISNQPDSWMTPNSSQDDLEAFKDSFQVPEKKTFQVPTENDVRESARSNSKLNKPVGNLSMRDSQIPRSQQRSNRSNLRDINSEKTDINDSEPERYQSLNPTNRKISPIHELEEHETPDMKDPKPTIISPTGRHPTSPRNTPPVKDANPRIDRYLNDPIYNSNSSRGRLQNPTTSALPPKSRKGVTGMKPNTSTIDSISESRNSFTIVLDETEKDGEISYASTPTILKDSTINDSKQVDDPKKMKLKPATNPKFDRSGVPPKNSEPDRRNPVSVVELDYRQPAAVNLISYDEWKSKFAQEVDPSDKIRKPMKTRRNPRSVGHKNKPPSLREKKRRQNIERLPPEKANREPLQEKPLKTISNEPKAQTSAQVRHQSPSKIPVAVNDGRLAKPNDHPQKQRKQNLENASRPKRVEIARPDTSRSKSADRTKDLTPIKPQQSSKLSLSASTSKSPAGSREDSRLRKRSKDEKMGFNVALDSFRSPSRKSSPSPRNSPRVTPQNSFERNNRTSNPRYIPPPVRTPIKTPTAQRDNNSGRSSQQKPLIVSKLPSNFKLSQNDFKAKRNFFEISAQLAKKPQTADTSATKSKPSSKPFIKIDDKSHKAATWI